jgi:hypothetical protein
VCAIELLIHGKVFLLKGFQKNIYSQMTQKIGLCFLGLELEGTLARLLVEMD